TTVLDMPNTLPTTSTAEQVAHKRQLADRTSFCDLGVFGLLAADNLDQLGPMSAAGAIGLKCFLGQSVGDIPPPDDGTLLDGLAAAARLGLRTAFHAENGAILARRTAQLQSAGRDDALAHLEARPVVAELEAIQRAALFARHAGAAIHILHLSSREGLASVEAWRGAGVDVTCEVTPHHCFLTSEDVARLGPIARVNPPVREPEHAQALLQALARGSVDVIASDHAPHTAEEKLQPEIWRAASGFAGVETSLALFLTLGVHAQRLSLMQLARLMSERPARLWRLYPRKGTLRVGSDADLTVVDLRREWTISSAKLHGKNNLSPWEGCRARGMAVATVLRGRVVMRDGELVDARPAGRFVAPCRTA
ncbi:MAG: dihydroorotase family protein, partial [Chloroflexota bacterium]|nr:dihydroorotase family protein [Chloroflexota bacterium]